MASGGAAGGALPLPPAYQEKVEALQRTNAHMRTLVGRQQQLDAQLTENSMVKEVRWQTAETVKLRFWGLPQCKPRCFWCTWYLYIRESLGERPGAHSSRCRVRLAPFSTVGRNWTHSRRASPCTSCTARFLCARTSWRPRA